VTGDPLLAVRDLRTTFPTDAGVVTAVDRVSFEIGRGEVLAVVGESGSGKSVTAMSIVGLVPEPGAVQSGEVLWQGRDLLRASRRELRAVRGAEIGVIFQDPTSALNPVHTVGHQIAEAVLIHRRGSRRQAMERAIEMMSIVGIPQARQRAASYPYEFSGGMRQRVMIAMAIVNEPALLIADEPTTALDVTIQAQLVAVLHEIRERTGAAMLLITHDLGLVAGMADEVLVMYAGRVVERGGAVEVFRHARHPYTHGLLASLPRLDGASDQRLRPIVGGPPSLLAVPTGCSFHPRCPFARLPAPCASVEPVLEGRAGTPGGAGHGAACHFAPEVGASTATGAGGSAPP
jgi:oligopeptide/dipeptide ABC transporter ATP-binding protein